MNSFRGIARAPVVSGLILASGLAFTLPAQQLTVTPAVATPGQQMTARLFNDTESPVWYPLGCGLRVLRHSGEFVSNAITFPGLPSTVLPGQLCDGITAVAPGTGVNIPFQAPTEGGSYTLVFVFVGRAATSFAVSAPTANARQLSLYPSNVRWPQRAHEMDFATPANTTWEFANTGATSHTFAAGDKIELFTPGAGVPVASMSLAGTTVPPGGVTQLSLPVSALAAAPYAVEATYVDPGAGGAVTTRSGIQELASHVELHMIGGHELDPGETLTMAVSLVEYPPNTGVDPFYVLMIGIQPGVTPLFGGPSLPLVLDPLALESAGSGIGGLLTNNVGQVPSVYPPGFPYYEGTVGNITFRHPNVAGVAGLKLRVAVLGVDAALTTWGASQSEELVLR